MCRNVLKYTLYEIIKNSLMVLMIMLLKNIFFDFLNRICKMSIKTMTMFYFVQFATCL